MDKLIAPNATRVLLNERFTILGNKNRVVKRIQIRKNSTRRNSRLWDSQYATGSGSERNQKLVVNLERKLKLQAALRLKKRSIQGSSLKATSKKQVKVSKK